MIYAGYCIAKPKRALRARGVVGVLLVRDGDTWRVVATETAATPHDAMQAIGGLYDRRDEAVEGDTFEWAGLLEADVAEARWAPAE